MNHQGWTNGVAASRHRNFPRGERTEGWAGAWLGGQVQRGREGKEKEQGDDYW